MFLDPRPEKNPTIIDSSEASDGDFFEAVKDVGDFGAIGINAHTITANPPLNPFYMIVKLPPYLIPQDSQLATAFLSCPVSFDECVSSPEIGYLMVRVIDNSSKFEANINDLPISISLTDSLFYSTIIEEA